MTRAASPPAVVHLDGCPADATRVESFTNRAPGGVTVAVTRCIECGAQNPSGRAAGAAPAAAPYLEGQVSMRKAPA